MVAIGIMTLVPSDFSVSSVIKIFCGDGLKLSIGPLKLGRQLTFGAIGEKFHNNLSAYCNSGGLKEH